MGQGSQNTTSPRIGNPQYLKQFPGPYCSEGFLPEAHREQYASGIVSSIIGTRSFSEVLFWLLLTQEVLPWNLLASGWSLRTHGEPTNLRVKFALRSLCCFFVMGVFWRPMVQPSSLELAWQPTLGPKGQRKSMGKVRHRLKAKDIIKPT